MLFLTLWGMQPFTLFYVAFRQPPLATKAHCPLAVGIQLSLHLHSFQRDPADMSYLMLAWMSNMPIVTEHGHGDACKRALLRPIKRRHLLSSLKTRVKSLESTKGPSAPHAEFWVSLKGQGHTSAMLCFVTFEVYILETWSANPKN